MKGYPEDAWERAMKVQELILRAPAVGGAGRRERRLSGRCGGWCLSVAEPKEDAGSLIEEWRDFRQNPARWRGSRFQRRSRRCCNGLLEFLPGLARLGCDVIGFPEHLVDQRRLGMASQKLRSSFQSFSRLCRRFGKHGRV